jgi:adenosylcobinamide-GDP ribazoletransferase
MKPLLAAIRFLTILPVPGTWGTATDDLARSVPYFPVVGLILGVIGALIAWAIAPWTPPLMTAAVIVLLLMAFSGCLHMDGLSDSADGFLSSRPRDRILEIMKDSRIGAMGVVAIVSVLLLKFAALASLNRASLWSAVLLMPLVGRSVMVLHMAILPYVRETGLASVFYRHKPRATAVWAACAPAIVAWFVLGVQGLAIWGICLAVALLMAAYVYRKIGGATGDTLGAVCELVEIVPAIVLAVWPIPS